MIPDTTLTELQNALARFDTELRPSEPWQNWENKQVYKYAIRDGGKLYPVKQVISMATGVPSDEFLGGREANSYVRQRGLRVVPLRLEETVLPALRRVYENWDSFANQAFVDDEVTYKHNTIAKAGELLSQNALAQLLSDENYDDFIQRLLIIGRDSNLLYQSQPRSGDTRILHLEELNRPAFCQAMFELLHGPDETAGRLGRYLEYVTGHNLPSNWAFPTYFLFVVHPQDELFIKPRVTQAFLELIKQPEVYVSPPTVESYLAIREIAYQLRDSLAGYQPRDMVDIQSVIWVVGRAAPKEADGRPRRYWKIAPGEGAWQWEECREKGFIALGWDEVGDVSLMSREQFDLRRDELVATHEGWGKKGVDQVWDFAHIGEGDRIIANRGTKEILGIGTVTGPYEFVPDTPQGHRLPVRWDEVTPKQIHEPSWVKTLIELNEDKFEQLCQSSILETGRSLAEPFNRIFQDWDEAGWAFDLLKETLQLLGVTGPDDTRLAVTVPDASTTLRLNFSQWAVLQFYGPNHSKAPLRIGVAFLEDRISFEGDYYKWGSFSGGDPKIAVYDFPIELARPMSAQMRQAYEDTFREIGARMRNRTASSFRRYNQPEIAEAVFNPAKRDDLLAHGLAPQSPMTAGPASIPANSYFTADTQALLAGLHLDPTKEYYLAHKEKIKTDLEEPFQQLMADIAASFPPAIGEVMETEKKIFGRILKNDYGQGGAWDYYWGAFYPKGGKRTENAQLSMWLNHRFLECGFYIGAYGSESRHRFVNNCQTYYHRLLPLLEDALSRDGLYFSPQKNLTVTEAGEITPHEAITWQEWLQNPARTDCDASFIIPWPRLRQYSRAELAETVRGIHSSLFPLVLLANYDDPIPAILDYLGAGEIEETDEPTLNDSYSLGQMAAETGLDESTLSRWVAAIERKKQAVLYGPPGTGKTFAAKRLARHLIGGQDGFMEVVQFHPSYAYEDFVQGIRPQPLPDGGLSYRLVSGRFMDFCQQARARTGPCVLIIDEINRANLSRVFGELMFLLEYREEAVLLAGSSKPFSIPENVRLIGTMNTADRSIALVDHALRRRFAFLALQPNFEILRRFHQERQTGFPIDSLIVELRRLNQQIDDPNYAVGISFFLNDKLVSALGDIWQMEIEPYLEEYFFDRPEAVAEFRWGKLRDKLSL